MSQFPVSGVLGLIGLLLVGSAGAQAADAQNLRECGGEPGVPAWVEPGVYSGTLGTLEITLELAPQPPSPDRAPLNRYFYAGRAGTLELTAFHSGNTLIMQEEVRPTQDSGWVVTGCFTLEQASGGQTAAGGWRGSWKAPGTARLLKVVLKPLNVARAPLQLPTSPSLLALRRTDPLTFLRLNQPWKLTPERTQEPFTGLSYPRVPGNSPALVSALQDRLLAHAVSALDCASLLPQDAASRMDGYELRASVSLLTPRLLSVREDINYYCGGAHPGGYTAGLILDRIKGRPVRLQHLWPSLSQARLKDLYLGAFFTAAASGCDQVVRDAEANFSVNLNSAGLVLTPAGLPHVVAACAESVVVPYVQLQRGANTGSPYFADLYKK